MDIKLIKAMGKGAVTYVPFVNQYINWNKQKSTHSGSDALFCFTLWMKALTFLKNNNLPLKFNSFAELGTGGSLGIGFCALLTGTKKYTCLEIEKNINPDKNVKLFEEILSLFNNNAKVPSYEDFGQINIQADGYECYNQLIEQSELLTYRNPNRIKEIKKSILSDDQKMINYAYNWNKDLHKIIKVDMVFSRAVMEHVNSPENVYDNLVKLLKNDGIMLHDIEFHSHGITQTWDGHHKINATLWSIICGNRRFFLNRLKYSDHKKLIIKNKFTILNEIINNKSINNKYDIYGATVLAKRHDLSKN